MTLLVRFMYWCSSTPFMQCMQMLSARMQLRLFRMCMVVVVAANRVVDYYAYRKDASSTARYYLSPRHWTTTPSRKVKLPYVPCVMTTCILLTVCLSPPHASTTSVLVNAIPSRHLLHPLASHPSQSPCTCSTCRLSQHGEKEGGSEAQRTLHHYTLTNPRIQR